MSLAQEYQLGIDTTGLVMGAGTDYIVHSWEGQGLPGMRASDRVRPFDHGSFMGSEYAEARQVTINMTIRGDDAADCQANLDALSRAWQFDSRSAATYDETTNLRVLMPGLSERLLKGRPRKVSLDTSNLKSGKATATLEFIAGDPRWYGATLRQATLNVTAPASGRSYDRSFDYGYGGGGSSAAQTITNDGSFPTPPTLRVFGPLTNVTVTNETTGESLTLTYAVQSGEYLDVDFSARTVLLNGTASRYYAMSGSWWELPAGSSTVRMSANSGTGTVLLSWRDAWI